MQNIATFTMNKKKTPETPHRCTKCHRLLFTGEGSETLIPIDDDKENAIINVKCPRCGMFNRFRLHLVEAVRNFQDRVFLNRLKK